MFSKEQHRGNLSLQKLNRADPILLKVKIFKHFRKVMKFPASVNYIHYIISNLMSWSIYILFNCLSYGSIYSNGAKRLSCLVPVSFINFIMNINNMMRILLVIFFLFVLDSTLSYFLQTSHHMFADVSPISSSSAY